MVQHLPLNSQPTAHSSFVIYATSISTVIIYTKYFDGYIVWGGGVGTFVLSEFSAVTGNTPAVVQRILEKLSEVENAESRLCFSQDLYIFHILRSDGLTFFCMSFHDTLGSKVNIDNEVVAASFQMTR
ncbi:Vesicle-associated membrane protein [Forsythia ovata]|uniref:Vesicle-associated membrane protein n=1 Tax=Forsythia ovata TaxID=205694 RepID=A0ABD1P4C4_9LAMI